MPANRCWERDSGEGGSRCRGCQYQLKREIHPSLSSRSEFNERAQYKRSNVVRPSAAGPPRSTLVHANPKAEAEVQCSWTHPDFISPFHRPSSSAPCSVLCGAVWLGPPAALACAGWPATPWRRWRRRFRTPRRRPTSEGLQRSWLRQAWDVCCTRAQSTVSGLSLHHGGPYRLPPARRCLLGGTTAKQGTDGRLPASRRVATWALLLVSAGGGR